MPKVSDMFPSKYLKAENLNGQPWTLTIERVELVDVFNPRTNTKQSQWVVYFQGAQKGLILNKTNALALAEICGMDDSDHWLRHRVTIYPERIRVGPDWKLGIRVRKPNGQGSETAPDQLDQVPEEDF